MLWCGGAKSPWKELGGEELEWLLKHDPELGGAPVALLDARFLIRLAKAGGRLLRRQQIPEDAFISLEELRRMPNGLYGSLRVICLSYPWLTPRSPLAASPAPSPSRSHADARRLALSLARTATPTRTARRCACSPASSRSSSSVKAPSACSSISVA